MHPGPMNRGVEIAGEVADLPQTLVILDQVRNGVAVRMAVLFLARWAPSDDTRPRRRPTATRRPPEPESPTIVIKGGRRHRRRR